MTPVFTPTQIYRSSLKRGMDGWDVWAVQIALNSHIPSPNLVLDGVAGPKFEQAVKSVQTALKVHVDGIIGPVTQAAFCAVKCNRTKTIVPAGLVTGICFGESSGIIPTTSKLYSNDTRDYGPLQNNKPAATVSQAELREAYNPEVEAQRVAHEIRNTYERFRKLNHGLPTMETWRLAILNYNWEAAAEAIVKGEGATWHYEERGTKAIRRLSDNTPWVEEFKIPYGGGIARTGWDWATYYIDSKSVYVKTWAV